MSKASKSSGRRSRSHSDPAPLGGIYNTFLSWSGARSRAVATALRAWLPRVIQACAPWMSAEDIQAGKRWRREVANQLRLEIGVLCLTPENVQAPWINFEAGALSRSVADDSRVIPYCHGLGPADYGDPLGDFNGVRADRDGTLKLVRSINAAMERSIRDEDLERVFDRMWNDLEAELEEIPEADVPVVSRRNDPAPTPVNGYPLRPDRELLEEVLERVRRIDDRPQPLDYVASDGTVTQGLLSSDRVPPKWQDAVPPPSANIEDLMDRLYDAVGKEQPPKRGPRK